MTIPQISPPSTPAPTPRQLADYCTILLNFFEKAGAIAVAAQYNTKVQVKKDLSLLTEADLKISALGQQLFTSFEQQGHLIIDEETFKATSAQEKETLFKTYPTIWAIDPIDGTAPYAAGLPTYAIVVGALHGGQPLMGGAYMPAVGELYLYDGTQATLTTHAFTPKAITKPLRAATTLSRASTFGLTQQKHWPQHLTKKTTPCALITTHATAVGLAKVAAGHMAGAYFQANLWDMAGLWPLLHAAGAEFFNLHTGNRLETITPDLFTEDGWYFKKAYIACSPGLFAPLQRMLAPST